MQDNCFFCDKSQFEERLIGETNEFWIIATLGQIIQGGYVLLAPKRHIECIGALEEREIDLMCAVKDRIYSALGYFNEASPLTIFEHGIAGQSLKHANLHIVPASSSFTDLVIEDFLWSERYVMPVMQNSWHSLRKAYALKKEPYLLWKDSGLGIKVCWNPKKVPKRYLRNLFFTAIGQPKLANYLKVDPEEDRKRWQKTVRNLKPYFAKK